MLQLSRIQLALLLGLAVCLAQLSAPAEAARKRALAKCDGQTVTQGCDVNGRVGPCQGTAGNDVIIGTGGMDVIHGRGGDDHIVARGGADVICGGGGEDQVFGGGGGDTIFGEGGDDDLRGEGGGDTIDGGGGSGDRVNGGSGNDACIDPGSATFTQCEFFDQDDDGFAENVDCDDDDSAVFPSAADALCNGVDDDCDGAVDEDYLADASCFLPGECAAGNAASTCVAGTETACQTGVPTAESCDSKDNDCNGTADDGVPDMVMGTDVGECRKEIRSCVGGSFKVAQAEIPPAPEICDGLDNDCDGVADDETAHEACPDDGNLCTFESCNVALSQCEIADAVCPNAGEYCIPFTGECAVCPCDGKTELPQDIAGGEAPWSDDLDVLYCGVPDVTQGLVGANVSNGTSPPEELNVQGPVTAQNTTTYCGYFDCPGPSDPGYPGCEPEDQILVGEGTYCCFILDIDPSGGDSYYQELSYEEALACQQSLQAIAASDGVECTVY